MARRTFVSLDELKNTFGSNKSGREGGGDYYLFWDMPEGKQSVVRFLPDKDLNNPNFLEEKKYHELPIDGQNRKFNCLENYKEKCPICTEAQKYYRNEGDNSKTGKQLYKKRKWIGQVLVVDDQTPPDPTTGKNANGEVKLISLSSQVFKPIKATIEAKELDGIPQDYDLGTNFIIRKTKDGLYMDYSTSRFERKSTRLEDDVVDFVETKLVDLKTTIPVNTGPEPLLQALDDYFNGTSNSNHQPKVEYPRTEAKTEAPVTKVEYKEPAESPRAEPKTEAAEDMDDDTAALLERIMRRKAATAE